MATAKGIIHTYRNGKQRHLTNDAANSYNFLRLKIFFNLIHYLCTWKYRAQRIRHFGRLAISFFAIIVVMKK